MQTLRPSTLEKRSESQLLERRSDDASSKADSLLDERIGNLAHDLSTVVHVDRHRSHVGVLVDLGLANGERGCEVGSLLWTRREKEVSEEFATRVE